MANRSSLFKRTANTLVVAFVAFQLLTLGILFYFVLLPLASRAADDLAELIVLSAQTWVELPPETRVDFEKNLAMEHGLWLFVNKGKVRGEAPVLPYLLLIQSALRKYMQQDVEVVVADQGEPWFWVGFEVAGQSIQVGFPHGRVGAQPLLAIMLLLSGGLALSWFTALLLARRITRPLALMSHAVDNLGQGMTPDLLPESGDAELANLARHFNQMAAQVRELLNNRTTLLAGISHDLRTPLARMRLAIEMLSDPPDSPLVARLHADVAQMERLISSFLDLSKGLAQEPPQEIDLCALLNQLAEDARHSGGQVILASCHQLWVIAAPLALQRVLSNLLDNALRYGAGTPVELACVVPPGEAAKILVLDRGSGIPQDQLELVFQPFYRIEASRSQSTGGSGLGLSIARQLAQANGWTLSLHAREGGGTVAEVAKIQMHQPVPDSDEQLQLRDDLFRHTKGVCIDGEGVGDAAAGGHVTGVGDK